MMAGIYCADTYCDGCIDEVKDEIAFALWADKANAICPDGTTVCEFESFDELYDYLDDMDERYYDSDEYPKWCSDNEESDCPEHCGDCGDFFGNDLTSEGMDYVKETIESDLREGREDSIAVTVWMPFYDWIDYDTNDED